MRGDLRRRPAWRRRWQVPGRGRAQLCGGFLWPPAWEARSARGAGKGYGNSFTVTKSGRAPAPPPLCWPGGHSAGEGAGPSAAAPPLAAAAAGVCLGQRVTRLRPGRRPWGRHFVRDAASLCSAWARGRRRPERAAGARSARLSLRLARGFERRPRSPTKLCALGRRAPGAAQRHATPEMRQGAQRRPRGRRCGLAAGKGRRAGE